MLSWLTALAAAGVVLWLARPHRWGALGAVVAALPAGAAFAWLLTEAVGFEADQVRTESLQWLPAFDLEVALRLDGLALFFSLIITGVGAAIAVYAGGYFGSNPRLGYFHLLLYAFMASMLGLVWADNLLALFSFWELTSITSFLLIGFGHTNPRALAGARRSLVVTGFGGLAMLGGFVVLGNGAGTFTISELVARTDLAEVDGFIPAALLIMIGAFTKSAQYPFHFWLPGAMAAPTPASAYLHSATMVKAGVYLLARLHPAMASTDIWFWTLLLVGGVTMVVGATHALAQTDLKALLAYATISQLGILVMLLAFEDKAAYKALVVGILAHALYKGPLFMVAGIVDLSTGTRTLDRLADLRRHLPIVTVVAVLGAVSMAGLPPTFGFLAKETLLEVPLDTIEAGRPIVGWLTLLAAAVAGAFFVAYSFRFLWEPFFRSADRAPGEVTELRRRPGPTLWAGPLVLVSVGTVIPFVSPLIEEWLFEPAASAVAGADVVVEPRLWHGLTPALLVSTIVIATGYALFRYRTPAARAVVGYPGVFHGDRLFDAVYDGSYRLARGVTLFIQDRALAGHAVVVLTAVVSALIASFVISGTTAPIDIDTSQRPEVYEIIVAGLAVLSAVTTLLARTRLNQIIGIGVVGVMVTLIFVDFSAPDLALTQLAVDILTVVLLILVFYRMRPSPPQDLDGVRLWRNRLVAAAVGLFGLVTVLLAGSARITETPPEGTFPPISDFHLTNSAPGGQGENVVNVILVDFRAFDTFGEIAVLAIAAVGAFSLIRTGRLQPVKPGQDMTRPAAEGDVLDNTPADQEAEQDEAGIQREGLPELYLQILNKGLSPILAVLTLWLLWRGHNDPGGGFIAGLVAATIVQLQILSRDERTVRRVLGPWLHPLTGAGLLLAAGSALLGLFSGPLFTGLWTKPELGPWTFSLGTPLLFDIGVFLVVFSVVGSFLLALSRGQDRIDLNDPADRIPT